MSDEDGIRSDERERLSARVYELGWCPTCARNLDAAELAAAIMVDPAEVLSPEELAEYERCQQSVIDARRRAPMVEGEIVVGGRVPTSSEPRPTARQALAEAFDGVIHNACGPDDWAAGHALDALAAAGFCVVPAGCCDRPEGEPDV